MGHINAIHKTVKSIPKMFEIIMEKRLFLFSKQLRFCTKSKASLSVKENPIFIPKRPIVTSSGSAYSDY